MKHKPAATSREERNISLPATFTTGFKEDLETAREMIRARKGARPELPVQREPADETDGVPEFQPG